MVLASLLRRHAFALRGGWVSGDGSQRRTRGDSRGGVRADAMRRGCLAERIKDERAFLSFVLHPSQTASAEASRAEIGQFFCRGSISAVDSRKANGPIQGRHGRGFGKRGFGIRKRGNGDGVDKLAERVETQLRSDSSTRAGHAGDGGVAASPRCPAQNPRAACGLATRRSSRQRRIPLTFPDSLSSQGTFVNDDAVRSARRERVR